MNAGLRVSFPLLLCTLVGSMLVASPAARAAPAVYLASPQSLKMRDTWALKVKVSGTNATVEIEGTHPGRKACVQKPHLKVRYNAKKARVKTRQMARIDCATSKQTAEFDIGGRRAVEFFINGEIVAFLDLAGETRQRDSAVTRPLALPPNPKPGEPVFLVAPVKTDESGCYAIRGAKARKKGKTYTVKAKTRAGKDCDVEQDLFQVLVPLGRMKKGLYTLKAGGASRQLGVGVEVEADDDEPEAAPVAAAAAPEEPEGGPTEEPPKEEPETPKKGEPEAPKKGAGKGGEGEDEVWGEEGGGTAKPKGAPEEPGDESGKEPREEPAKEPAVAKKSNPKPAGASSDAHKPPASAAVRIDVY